MGALRIIHDKNKKPDGPDDASFVVESDVPVTPHKNGYATYPFARMNVGDSFAIKTDTMRQRVSSAVCHYVRENEPELKFTVRRVDDGGWRCWRMK